MALTLTLNVSESDFGHELKEIMATLTPEDKKEIAKSVFIQQLNELTDLQRTVHEKDIEVLKKVRSHMGTHEGETATDDQCRKHYKYKEYMANMKSAKEMAVDEIIKAGVDVFKKMATELVQNDPKIKEMWEAVKGQCTADFPKYVHDAMVYYFCSQMQFMASGIQEAMRQSQQAMFSMDQIRQRIN